MKKSIDSNKAVTQSEHNSDQILGIKTIYDVPGFEIFWRNFLAGMSRSFGGLVLYVLLVLVASNLFISYIYPHLEPLISEYRTAIRSFNQLSNRSNPNSIPQINNEEVQELMQDPGFLDVINRVQ